MTSDSTLAEPEYEAFDEEIHGQVLQPGDDGYDESREVWNAMIDKHPAVIIRCTGAADVIASVNFAREHDLPIGVKGNGHNVAGNAVCDDGLTIDLSGMTAVRVDPTAQTARVEPGATLADVDHETQAFGLTTPLGFVSETGIAGLTLGGGFGYLSRTYGMTVDNLRSVDIVTADGELLHASTEDNPDLFWAIRGGGGNFGVVTSFEYQLHPVETVVAGPMFWPVDALEETMRWYREWLPQQPEDVYAYYLTAEVPGDPYPFPEDIQGEKVCGLFWTYTGPAEEVESVLQPAREVAEPLFEHVAEMPYPELQSMFDALLPPGDQWYWKGDFVYELTDDAIAEHERFAEVPTSKSLMHLYPIDGAVDRVDAEETAWRHRDATWSMVIAGIDPDPAETERISEWAREYWEALHPHSADGAYVNFMMEEGEKRVRATYGDNYERLQEIKAKYDPDNFFHVNQNIEPAD